MASRYYTTTATHIRYSGFLVVDAQGGMSLARAEPKLKPGERAISLNVEVPKAIFRTPALRATIVVPEASAPGVINAATVEVLQDAIRMSAEECGLKVTFAAGPARE